MYRFGVISTASIVKRVIDAIRQTNNEVVAIASRSLDSAKTFAKENDIDKYYGSYDEIYEDKDIDIIYIPVINTLHYECAKKALEHHKHVLLEKPFTLSEKEAVSLFEIAKENNCFLMEGIKNIFMPSTKFIKDNLNKIGEIKSITSNQGTNKPFSKNHWMYRLEDGGGAYRGSAAYCYHLLINLFNNHIENPKADFIKSHMSADKEVKFYYSISNIPVTSIIDMEHDLDSRMVIYGSKGKIIIESFWRSHNVSVYQDEILVEEFKDSGNEFVHEINHVVDCLNKKMLTSNTATKERTIEVVSKIEELYK